MTWQWWVLYASVHLHRSGLDFKFSNENNATPADARAPRAGALARHRWGTTDGTMPHVGAT